MLREWLLFMPHLPSSPSSLRVMAWRRMRSAGAVGLQGGAWALPRTERWEWFIRSLLVGIKDNGGNGLAFIAAGMDKETDDAVVQRFRGERNHNSVY